MNRYENHILSAKEILTPEQVVQLVINNTNIEISATDTEILLRNAELFQQKALQSNAKIYGTTTGFGPFVQFANTDNGMGLLTHLSAGAGEITPTPIVRATLLLRIRTLLNGHSAIHPDVVQKIILLFNSRLSPEVPQIGSLGASGDLVPLAYCALPLYGIGDLLSEEGVKITAQEFWQNYGGELAPPTAREALALTNGTSYSTAYSVFALEYSKKLLRHTETLVGGLYSCLRARREALHPALHEAKLHNGSIISARNIYAISGDYAEDENRPLQEIYSLRCAPQILGAIRDVLQSAEQLIQNEIHATDDNPLCIAAEEGEMMILHGGNFYGQHIAFASDMISMAVTKLALYIERLIALIAEPKYTYSTPLLAAEPGIDSGIAGLQLTATALTAEVRSGGLFHSTATIPTNGNNQDIVSMSALSARKAYKQTELTASVLSALEVSLLRLYWLTKQELPAELATLPRMQHSTADTAYRKELAERAARMLRG